MSFVLAFSDVVVLVLVSLAAMSLRLGDFGAGDRYFYLNYFWVPILLLIIIYANNGLYPGLGLSAVEDVRRLSLSRCRCPGTWCGASASRPTAGASRSLFAG